MARRAHPNLTLLALATASGLLFASESLKPMASIHLAALRSQESQRVSRICDRLTLQKESLGLGTSDGLQKLGQTTDVYGRTHVHFQQTYLGVKVWGTRLIGTMDADGALHPARATVQKDIHLEPVPLISEERLRAIVARNLPEKGEIQIFRAEKVLFPTQCQDGIKFVRNSENQLVLDTKYSVGTARAKEPFVWAFHASVMQSGNQGPMATEFVLDGRSGEILKKWNGAQHQTAPTAEVGTGKSQYNGNVALNTQKLADGTYALRDTTRPTKSWPMAADIPSWAKDCAGVGNYIMYWDINNSATGHMHFHNTTNAWGDGLAFAGTLGNANSETSAVDAHYAIQSVWDYFAKVHGRTGGIDGQGSSIMANVHYTETGDVWQNAAWYPSYYIIRFGDGAPTGSLACLDVAGHEMAHGVNTYTANLGNGEAEGLNESNSDVHGTMMKYWAWGDGGLGSTIPETVSTSPEGNDPKRLWTIGSQIFGADAPLRWMYKPSKDGYSYDAWFQGLGLDDSHFTSGPGNRAFYFMSQGASPDASQDTYSVYLPNGMEGIGNDKAAKIWFNAMTTKVTNPSSDYPALRVAMVESATELYGAASPELAAVKNAFAGINVGAPEGGQEPPQVRFQDMPGAKDVFFLPTIIVAPFLVPVSIPTPTVTNSSDTSCTVSMGGGSITLPTGGKLLDEGRAFLAPTYLGSWTLKATSKADPRRFAVTQVFGVNLDCDADTETDACDLAPIALSYFSTGTNYPAANLYNGWFVDNICVSLFKLGFNNAFNH